MMTPEETVPEGASPATDAETAPPDAAAELDRLRAELEAERDRALRLRADWENYRRRAQRDLEEERRFALAPLLRDLLPVVDNVQRAIAAASQQAEAGSLLEGFRLVLQQLERVLEQHACQRIAALHVPFDPNLHSAILQQPSTEHAAGTVVQVVQDGYQVHERVLRPAQVIVAAPAVADAPPA